MLSCTKRQGVKSGRPNYLNGEDRHQGTLVASISDSCQRGPRVDASAGRRQTRYKAVSHRDATDDAQGKAEGSTTRTTVVERGRAAAGARGGADAARDRQQDGLLRR
eukprot:scaffold8544_cov78-Phaeocystis_antarctica.AAC.1